MARHALLRIFEAMPFECGRKPQGRMEGPGGAGPNGKEEHLMRQPYAHGRAGPLGAGLAQPAAACGLQPISALAHLEGGGPVEPKIVSEQHGAVGGPAQQRRLPQAAAPPSASSALGAMVLAG